MRARYEAVASSHRTGAPTVYWQLGYVLAPAREWGGFGGLAVTVHLPPNWDAAASLPLTRDGDTLKGSFPNLPADALGLTAQAPVPPEYEHLQAMGRNVWSATLWGGPAVLLLAGVAFGAWLGRRGRTSAWALLLGLVLGLLWTAALMGAGHRMLTAHFAVLPPGQQAVGSGVGIALLVGGVLCLGAIPAGVLLTQVAAWLTCRLTFRPGLVSVERAG